MIRTRVPVASGYASRALATRQKSRQECDIFTRGRAARRHPVDATYEWNRLLSDGCPCHSGPASHIRGGFVINRTGSGSAIGLAHLKQAARPDRLLLFARVSHLVETHLTQQCRALFKQAAIGRISIDQP